MATLTTFTAGTVIHAGEVNANFSALNTEVGSAMVCLYSNYGIAGTSGTTATDIKSFTMAADTLAAIGSGLRVCADVTFSADAFNKTLVFYCGTAVGLLNPTTAAPNNKNIHVDLWVIRSTSTACYIHGLTVLSASGLPTSPALEGAGLFNAASTIAGAFSAAMTVRLVGQCANAASVIECDQMSVWAFNGP